MRLGVRAKLSLARSPVLRSVESRSWPPPIPTCLPPVREVSFPIYERRCADAFAYLREQPSAYLLRFRVVTATPLLAKKMGREGQQRHLRSELRPAGTALAGILSGLGTHIAKELPRLEVIFRDAGGCYGGSGH